MKKYILSFFIYANILCVHTTFSCPYNFSPDDQRPFFEQYEIENNIATTEEKEEK
ncbi:MAG TPA: hypothetical protein VJJ26_02395 [Candidatus Babeliales bacterium]|nr:hypothetical protein [Candidatus Babeliales bacterium]